jgi:glycosyltransferase involved in cell wall biosynthesis
MSVALVSYGFAEYCVPIANALSEHADVTLLLPKSEAEPIADEISPDVLFTPFLKPRLRQPVHQILLCSTLVRQIRHLNPDVVHLQHGHLWFNFALPFLRAYPLVVTIHDPRHHLGDRASQRTPQWILDMGFRRAAAVIVHGENLRRQVADLFHVPHGIHVIPNLERAGVGLAGPPPEAAPGQNIVLFFGRIWPYKGLDYLIRAQPYITAAVPDATIVIAGEGENFEPYRELMRDPDTFVVHNELISNEKRSELFTNADVVVLPYVEASQSAVVAVAYAYERPVVASNVGAIGEIVDHEKTGLLVPARDELALAHAVIRILRAPELGRRLGRDGRRKIEREYSAATVAERTIAVYENVLADHASRNVDRAKRGEVNAWESNDER